MTETAHKNREMPQLSSGEIAGFKGPEFILSHARLYHGSVDADLPRLLLVEREDRVNNTLGRGLYFVTDPIQAAAYAKRRAKAGGSALPTVYEVETAVGLKIANLDNASMLHKVMNGFADRLMEQLATDRPWFVVNGIHNAIEAIRGEKVVPGNVRAAAWNHEQMFADYLREQGYNGARASEGGEGEVGSHVSVVVYNPDDVNIVDSSPVSGMPPLA